ncbi:MAG: hypothetical protein MK086_14830, partial [Flavobacteriales bacterium]|nr:hypothetical protein [Flavobacteriales bacterium]
KKWLYAGGCTLVGGALGAEAGKKGESPNTTTANSAGWSGFACFALADTILKDKKEQRIADLQMENSNLKRGMIDGRLEDRDRDDVLRLSPPRQTNCQGEMKIVAICPDENGDVGACKGKIGWQYVNDGWAVKWIAYKSVEACFIPPYKAPFQIEKLTRELERSLKS